MTGSWVNNKHEHHKPNRLEWWLWINTTLTRCLTARQTLPRARLFSTIVVCVTVWARPPELIEKVVHGLRHEIRSETRMWTGQKIFANW